MATAAVALLGAAALAGPPTVSAATVPVVNGTTVTITGDDAPDRVTIADNGENLTIAVNGGAATKDFGGQVLPIDNSIDLVFNAGGGDDEITIATPNLKSVVADGGAGDDILTGNNDADHLIGGADDDRIIGARGGDDIDGGTGNDVLVWNNGDGSDTMDGDGGGADEIEVNGAPSQADDFKIAPNPADAARVRFERLNLVPFNLNVNAERITVNGLGGDDVVNGNPGLAPLIAVTANGGTGADTLNGGDGADLLNGGEDNDALSGAAGNDRLVGDRGGDVMNGGDGEDTTVWNNGDGSDVMNGDAGVDRVEVNGANADETFTLTPNGARAKFDRTSAGAFSLDINSEALQLNTFGGNDSLTTAPGTGALLAVTADAGAGNDTLAGAEETDAFFGGSGNDTLTGGNGSDLLDGQDGDDALRARDGQGDLVRGAAGTDSAQTDAAGIDVTDAVESIDAPVVTAPPPADTKATAARVRAGKAAVAIRNGKASTRLALECPAAEAGGCIGTVTLISAKPVKIGGERVIAVLGSARYSLKAGERKTVTVALPKGARKLAVKRAIAARAQTVTRDAAGNVAVGSRAVSLKLPRLVR